MHKPDKDHIFTEPSEIFQAVLDSIFNTESLGTQGPEVFVANRPGTIIPNDGGIGPPDPPGNPEAVNVTSKTGFNTATVAEAALGLLGGPIQSSLLGAVTSGVFGTFGVVGGSHTPPVGTLEFAREVAATQEARDLETKKSGIAGHSAISAALGADFGDDFGNIGDFSETGDAANPGGGGRDSGGDSPEGPSGGGTAGSDPGGTGGGGRDSGPGGFAHGGRPPVGVPVIVGEDGPEEFVPDRPDNMAIGEQIIKQAGIQKIAEMFGVGDDDEKENKKKKTSSKKKKADGGSTKKTEKSATKTSKPEDDRTNLEQLFLDLVNGKLSVQL